jgi:hypothetical protein
MKVKLWTNTRPFKMLDVLEIATAYKVGDDSPYGHVITILPSHIFQEAEIDQHVAVDEIGEQVELPENSIFKAPVHHNRITLYPLYSAGRHPWDEGALADPRYEIMEGVTIENVSLLITPETFSVWKGAHFLSADQLESLENIKYAIVHRYSVEHASEPEMNQESQQLVGKLTVCLLLVRPMRRNHAGIVQGVVLEDGTFEASRFGVAEPVEVPHVQKHFYFREQDVAILRAIAPEFLKATEDSDGYDPLKMALQFFEQGHLHHGWWKVRHFLWWSALEALFGNNSDVLKVRILSLFGNKDLYKGEEVSIYETGDIHPAADFKPHETIGSTLNEIYEVRNMIGHGRRVPQPYLTAVPHVFNNAELGRVEILAESASFIIRKTLIHIFSQKLFSHYIDIDAREEYWLNKFGINRHQAEKKLKELEEQAHAQKAARLQEKGMSTQDPEAALTEDERRERRRSKATESKIRKLPE